jgi:hypothetical protein
MQAQERYRGLLREAEQQRRVAEAIGSRTPSRRSSKLLVWLGHQFIVWGTRLQARYQAAPVGSH